MLTTEQVLSIKNYAKEVDTELDLIGFDERAVHYIQYANLNPFELMIFMAQIEASYYHNGKPAKECAATIFNEFIKAATKLEAEFPNIKPFAQQVH